MTRHNARSVRKMDRDHLVHPARNVASIHRAGGFIVGAAGGMHVTEVAGRKLPDGIAARSRVLLGHGQRDRIADALGGAIEDFARRAYGDPSGGGM